MHVCNKLLGCVTETKGTVKRKTLWCILVMYAYSFCVYFTSLNKIAFSGSTGTTKKTTRIVTATTSNANDADKTTIHTTPA